MRGLQISKIDEKFIKFSPSLQDHHTGDVVFFTSSPFLFLILPNLVSAAKPLYLLIKA
jgi:hypothetical protein